MTTRHEWSTARVHASLFVVVFVSLLFWGWVLGPVGMLLSVPLTATLKIALEAFPEGQAVARMLGSGEPTS